MLKKKKILKNLLKLVGTVKKNEVMDSNRFSKTNKNLFNSQK